MAKHSLDHQLQSLNISINFYDSLFQWIEKAHALVHVALSEHFASCEHSIIHNYLLSVEDAILSMRNAFESEFNGQGDTIKDFLMGR